MKTPQQRADAHLDRCLDALARTKGPMKRQRIMAEIRNTEVRASSEQRGRVAPDATLPVAP